MQESLLKTHQGLVKQAIEEAFAIESKGGIVGTLNTFVYTEGECSNFGGRPESGPDQKKYGPGIQVVMEFQGIGKQNFFYADSELGNLRAFLNNLNTDVGMTEIRCSKKTQSLGITLYDLEANTITFKASDGCGKRFTVQGFNKCWDVNALTFDPVAFKQLKTNAEQIAGIKVHRTRGDSVFSEEPFLTKPIQVLGIDTQKFLSQLPNNGM